MDAKGYVGTGIALLGLAMPVAGDLPHWVGWAGIALGLVVMFVPVAKSRRSIRSLWEVSLQDAMQKAFEKTQFDLAGKAATAAADGFHPDILGWYFHWFAMHGVIFYGTVPPGNKRVQVPEAEMRRLRPTVGQNTLSFSAAAPPAYANIVIKRRQLSRAIKEIKKLG